MKKTYVSPKSKLIKLNAINLFCGSNTSSSYTSLSIDDTAENGIVGDANLRTVDNSEPNQVWSFLW